MKHIRPLTVAHAGTAKVICADAKADLYNAVWQAWLDFVYTKKNQVVTPGTS